MTFCPQPFNRIEIHHHGEVFCCCPAHLNYYSLGNIFTSSFDEIWNGKKAIELRKKILSNDFSLCSDICNRKNLQNSNSENYTEIVMDYPEEVSITTDNTCNLRCKFCRDKFPNNNFDKEKFEEEIENIYLPILKNVKILTIGTTGEPFASHKEKLLIKRVAEKYPNIRFQFQTNGVLGNARTLKDLNIEDRIESIAVSIHAATRWTYNKIVRGGKFDKVLSNLELYSNLKKENKLNKLRIIFVVFSENYKEMPAFVRLAQKYNANAEFWALMEIPSTKVGQNFTKYSIVNPQHKDHKKLIKVLNDPIFNSENVIIYPELKKLREN